MITFSVGALCGFCELCSDGFCLVHTQMWMFPSAWWGISRTRVTAGRWAKKRDVLSPWSTIASFQEVSAAENYLDIANLFTRLLQHVMEHMKDRSKHRCYSSLKSMAKLTISMFGKRRKSIWSTLQWRNMRLFWVFGVWDVPENLMSTASDESPPENRRRTQTSLTPLFKKKKIRASKESLVLHLT